MSKRVFFRPQRARMRGNHETIKSPVRADDPYVRTDRRVEPLHVVQVTASNGQIGRSVPDGATVRVGAPRDDYADLPTVRFTPVSEDERERLSAAIKGFLTMRSTRGMVNAFHNVDWDDLVDFLKRIGGEL